MIFYEISKTFYFSKFSTASLTHSTHSLTHSLMLSVKRSGKLAKATASLLWWKCLEFHGEKTFHNINAYLCMHHSLTVLALILLYGSHCFSIQLPSKVTRGFTHHIRLPASRNNAPRHIVIFPDAIRAA